MARWVAFVGLTGVVLTLLLALARLSQATVEDHPSPLPAPGPESPEAATRGEGLDTGKPPEPYPDPDPERVDPTGPSEPRSLSEFSTGELLANVALTQGVFGFVVAAGAWYFEIPAVALGLAGGPWVTGLPALGLGLAFGVALWVANEVAGRVADAAGATYDEKLREALAPAGAGGWALLLGVVLPVVAVVEELIFRAAAIGATAAGLGVSPWPLVGVSSAAFALGHGAQGKVGVAVTGALGFVLGAAFVYTGSFLVVVVAHYLVNALEFLVHETR